MQRGVLMMVTSDDKEQKATPNYYSVIPATVRYCKNLSPQEKLLYSEITALTNQQGYCWATNNYFADLYEMSKETVSRQISKLSKHGFITIKMIYFEKTKQIKERRIYLSTQDIHKAINNVQHHPIDENVNTPIDENVNTPIDENVNTPIDENVKDNITRSNNKNCNSILSYPIISSLGGRDKKEDEMREDENFTKIDESAEQQKKESPANVTAMHSIRHREASLPRYDYNMVMKLIKSNIEFDYMLMDKTVSENMLEEVCHVITDTICNDYKDRYISMGNERVYAETVRSVFFKLGREDIEYYAENFNRQTKPITKTAAYIRTSLYRNYRTGDHHMTNRVHVDFPQYAEPKIQSKTQQN